MRLIDADALNKRLSEMEAEISEEDCMPGDAFSDGIISAILDIKKCIQNQEIVYDVDKVVDELEKTMQDLSVIEVFSHIDFDSTIQSSLDKFLKAYNSELLRIIKQGYVSDDVCEWKFEETNGIAWHCDDKCTTYNQVYIKDLKITLEDFECKCPYCGKKIKVVE